MKQETRRAASRAACTAGNNNATKTPMIVMTTSNSINEKPALHARRESPRAKRVIGKPEQQDVNNYCGLCPSQRAAVNALVGLLAPEFGPVQPSRRTLPRGNGQSDRTAHFVGQVGNLSYISLGYSGGAAPDSHRCSLFVGPSHGKDRPPTHIVTEMNLAERREAVKWVGKENPPPPFQWLSATKTTTLLHNGKIY